MRETPALSEALLRAKKAYNAQAMREERPTLGDHTPVTGDEAAFEAVWHLHEAWLAAELSGDIEGVLALCTSDVRWLAPGSRMLVGREEGRRLLTDTKVELENIVASDLQAEISGDMAYKTSRYETRYRLPGQGKLHVARGTHVWILRREGAEWRVALVAWQVEK